MSLPSAFGAFEARLCGPLAPAPSYDGQAGKPNAAMCGCIDGATMTAGENLRVLEGERTMTIKTRATVGADGMLHLNLSVGTAHAGEEVEVMVAMPGELADDGSSIQYPPGFRKMNHEEWRQFIAETAGSIRDPDFCRPPGGPPQDRGAIFD